MFSALLSSSLSAQSLTIAAAADLAPLETDLTEAFQRVSSTAVRFSFGSSGQLARQIGNGAPYDVYLSANESFVRELEQAGKLVAGSVRVYATGRLGLWSAGGDTRTLKDLTRATVRHIAIANPAHAPYGAAAEQALRHAGLWDQLQPKLVYAENVRQAFEYARTRNADAVITSWTLVHASGGTLLDASSHAPIRQAGAIVKGTPNEQAARAFLKLLESPAGRAILARHGLAVEP
jgi:molybdate transport system substrate-binding protein